MRSYWYMSNITLIDSTGRQRPAVVVQCAYCKTAFTTWAAPSRKAKYCSRGCSNKGSASQAVDIECAQCHKVFKKNQSKLSYSKSGLRFCTKKCKCEAQKLGGIRAIMPAHYGTANGINPNSHNYYRNIFSVEELVCHRCGYCEFSCAIDIHHKDKNRLNNRKENLIPLCANCHRGLHNNEFSLGD